MDRYQAKQLLLSGRPDKASTDRELAEALALVRRDAELRRWYLDQQSSEAAIRKALRSIAVPADLKSRILTAQKKPIYLWRNYLPRFAAAAAAVAVLVSAAVWLLPENEQKDIAGFQNRMVGFALREYRMDIVSSDAAEIRQYLAKQGAPLDFTIPSGVAALSPMGGARLSWQGLPVTMLCYRINEKEIAYFFAVPKDLGEVSGDALAHIATVKGLSTATWSSGEMTFVLAAPVPQDQLKRLL